MGKKLEGLKQDIEGVRHEFHTNNRNTQAVAPQQNKSVTGFPSLKDIESTVGREMDSFRRDMAHMRKELADYQRVAEENTRLRTKVASLEGDISLADNARSQLLTEIGRLSTEICNRNITAVRKSKARDQYTQVDAIPSQANQNAKARITPNPPNKELAIQPPDLNTNLAMDHSNHNPMQGQNKPFSYQASAMEGGTNPILNVTTNRPLESYPYREQIKAPLSSQYTSTALGGGARLKDVPTSSQCQAIVQGSGDHLDYPSSQIKSHSPSQIQSTAPTKDSMICCLFTDSFLRDLKDDEDTIGRECQTRKREVASYKAFADEAEKLLSPDDSTDFVVLNLGYNDLWKLRASHNDTLKHARRSVNICRHLYPNAMIVISEVINSLNSGRFNENIDKLNEGLNDLAKLTSNTIFSTHPVITPSERELYHPDGTHLSKLGQAQIMSDLRRATMGLNPLPNIIRLPTRRNHQHGRQDREFDDQGSRFMVDNRGKGKNASRFGANGWKDC